MSTTVWFYASRGRQQGPMGWSELLRRLKNRRSGEDVLVWREGLAEWAQPEEIPELSKARTAPWFAVGRTKLVVMSLVTLGAYEVYWFYRQWKCVQAQTAGKVYPVLGAIFSGISCFPLFKRIRVAGETSGASVGWSAPAMAGLYLLLSLLWRLPDPFWLACFLSIIPLAGVQASVNAINSREAPLADRNESFTGVNWVGVVVGGLLFLLGVIGTFLPEP